MSLPRYVVVDCETTGLSFMQDKLHGIGWLVEGDEKAVYSPAWDIPKRLIELLADPTVHKVGHNLHAFDAKFIRRAGLEINGEFDDTMVIWNLVDSDSPLGLKFLASSKLSRPEPLERKARLDAYIDKVGCGNIAGLCASDLLNSEHPHCSVIADYCCEDVENTRDLYRLGLEHLEALDEDVKRDGFTKGPLDYYREEARPLERVLFEIEYRGIKIDLDAINRLRIESAIRMAECQEELDHVFSRWKETVIEENFQKKLASLKTEKARARVRRGEGPLAFSWENPNHVARMIYAHLPSSLQQRTEKGKLKLDKSALDTLMSSQIQPKLRKALETYLEYRKWQKLASTYAGDEERGFLSRVVQTPSGPRIFPTYHQTSSTGRLKSSNPNMQNLPSDSPVKAFFVPDEPDEVIDDADYSQIELRVAADRSGDPGLCGAYSSGEDVHTKTARILFGDEFDPSNKAQRQAGKTTNFLTIYRGGSFRLQQTLHMRGVDFSVEECAEFIDRWFAAYGGVKTYLDEQQAFFEEKGYVISSFGRVRLLPDIRFIDGVEWTYGRPIWNEEHPLTEQLRERYAEAFPPSRGPAPTNSDLARFARKLYTHALKAGFNQPIQGFAASLAKRSMIELHRRGRKIMNQVHDSLSVARKRGDVASRRELLEVMEHVAVLKVPLIADCKTLSSFHPSHVVQEAV